MVIVDHVHLTIMYSHPTFLLQEVIVEGICSIMHLLEIHIPMLCQGERTLLSVRVLYFNQVCIIIPLDSFVDLDWAWKGVEGTIIFFFLFFLNMAQQAKA